MKLILSVVALTTLTACGHHDRMHNDAMAAQPMVVIAEPTMNKL